LPATPLVAFNPLPWFITSEGIFDRDAAPPVAEIYRQIRAAGYDAVHAEVPPGMSLADYRSLLSDTGLAPAPGYFQAPFAQSEQLHAIREEAARIAGQHAALGLDRIFIADQLGATPERMATPAVGTGFDQDRLDRALENLGIVAEAMTAEGVVPCLHQHVGSLIETEKELEAAMAAIDPSVLLLGPDTGHLLWVGADPAAVIERHRDRIGAVHLKDLRAARVERWRADRGDFRAALAGHIWTEPGRGDLDLDAVLEVLNRFDGWYVVEVDVADQPSPQQSAEVSAAWVHQRLRGQA
jgi:inosose dehydratase